MRIKDMARHRTVAWQSEIYALQTPGYFTHCNVHATVSQRRATVCCSGPAATVVPFAYSMRPIMRPHIATCILRNDCKHGKWCHSYFCFYFVYFFARCSQVLTFGECVNETLRTQCTEEERESMSTQQLQLIKALNVAAQFICVQHIDGTIILCCIVRAVLSLHPGQYFGPSK